MAAIGREHQHISRSQLRELGRLIQRPQNCTN